MKKSISSLAIVLCLLALTAGCTTTQMESALQGMPEDAPVKKIHMTAEKFKFTPDTVKVEKGTHLILEIESLDVTHEFRLDEYGIDAKIPAGKTVVVELYAAKPGEFDFGCHVGLGLHYSLGMKGKLIVEE